MRTEDDLRAAITTVADRAPSPDDTHILIPGDDYKAVRRPRVLATAIATTALVALAVPASSVLFGDEAQPGSQADRLELRSTFWITTVAGWQQESRLITLNDQRISLEDSKGLRCIVRVIEPGAFDAGRIPPGSAPLTVKGKPGYFARIKNPFDAEQPRISSPDPSPSVSIHRSGSSDLPWERTQWVVLWQYEDDAWAMSGCYEGTGTMLRDQEQRIADATTVERTPLRVPVQFTNLPQDQQPLVSLVRDPHISGSFMYDFDLSVGHGQGSQFIGYIAGESAGAPPKGSTRLTVNGLPSWIDPDSRRLVITGQGFDVIVSSAASGDTRPEAERRAGLLATAEGMRFAADPMDISTWFDGSTALPR